jgi:hypothetical protein
MVTFGDKEGVTGILIGIDNEDALVKTGSGTIIITEISMLAKIIPAPEAEQVLSPSISPPAINEGPQRKADHGESAIEMLLPGVAVSIIGGKCFCSIPTIQFYPNTNTLCLL